MTRHGKNATNASVYSYHERRRDQKQSGFGTLHHRLSKDSVKEFDCCSLTLQPCREPVVSHQGYIFDKEAILEYILNQKRENARKLKEWEKERRKEQVELEELAKAEKEAKAKKFMKHEATPAHPGSFADDDEPGTSNETRVGFGKHKKEFLSFWVPELQPKAEESKMEKPSQKVLCPMTKKPIKMRDLIPVIFTPIANEDLGLKLQAKKHRYMCPVTHDLLTNTTLCAVLKTSGNVVTMDCVENIIKKDWIDPTNGEKLTEADIIPLQRGGTGFASTNELNAKLARPVMELQ